MGVLSEILDKIKEFALWVLEALGKLTGLEGAGTVYTAIARWVFIVLALFIVVKAIASLLKSGSSPEVFAYFNVKSEPKIKKVKLEPRAGISSYSISSDYKSMNEGFFYEDVLDEELSEPMDEEYREEIQYSREKNYPITHWENAIGRSKSCDIVIDNPTISRNQGILNRSDDDVWVFTDLGSSNGTFVNKKKLKQGDPIKINPGDEIQMGDTLCTLFPISLEERRNNMNMRKRETFLLSPWMSLLALTLFQMMAVVQLRFALKNSWTNQIPIAFTALTLTMWIYVFVMRTLRRKGFEMEILAFFLCTLSLSVTSSKFPNQVLKQYIAILLGLLLFISMCTFLRNLERSKAVRKYLYGLAVIALIANLALAKSIFGANNWIIIRGVSVQPSEIIKLAFIWVGAASLEELMEKRSTLVFTVFSGFCFICLALMNDFGTALIFFVIFLVISFLRSGDFTKLILIAGGAFIGGLLVLRFKVHVAARFSAWRHVWEFADSTGYQQTRTMSAAASGGLVGVGAGDGWLKYIAASETDLVFGFITEEWGLIIALLAVLSILTLSIFAFRSIMFGRSTFYTIAACSSTALFLFQTTLNVFGSVDLLPLTGVTFPFLSTGGSSMVASWGMLAFLKAADTRLNASIAVANKKLKEVKIDA